MDIILATNNRKKLLEMQRILEPLGINAVTAGALGIVLPEVEETGATFEENARLKAVSAMQSTGLGAVADDSGLMVDFLGGAPGVYSARFSGEHGNDEKNNALLLKKLESVPESERGAHYVSAICCVFPDGREIAVRGECFGKIAFQCNGAGGFGYDPLFVVGGKTFAEYTPAEKDRVSHRGKALRLFAEELKKIIENQG